MVYENVSFNTKVVLKFNSVNEFVNYPTYQELWPALSKEKRKARLKEVYQLVKAHKNDNRK